MDIDRLYYLYTTVLGKSDEDFWNSTPRKIFSQLDIYNEIKTGKSKKTTKKENGRVVSEERNGNEIKETTKFKIL